MSPCGRLCKVAGEAGATRDVGIAAAYLSWLADSERKSFTIGRGPPPSATGTSSPARAVLRGIRRTEQARPRRRATV